MFARQEHAAVSKTKGMVVWVRYFSAHGSCDKYRPNKPKTLRQLSTFVTGIKTLTKVKW